jgi:hypothetical protein
VGEVYDCGGSKYWHDESDINSHILSKTKAQTGSGKTHLSVQLLSAAQMSSEYVRGLWRNIEGDM